MNTSISFPLAKLLIEKGFESKSPIAEYWDVEGRQFLIETWEDEYDSFHHEDCPHDIIFICAAPTIAEVVMWLYEKHGIWISVDRHYDKFISKKEGVIIDFDGKKPSYFHSPTEAYEAAIEYTLKNLIK